MAKWTEHLSVSIYKLFQCPYELKSKSIWEHFNATRQKLVRPKPVAAKGEEESEPLYSAWGSWIGKVILESAMAK